MSFYQYFLKSERNISSFGLKHAIKNAIRHISLIKSFIDDNKNNPSILEIGPGRGIFATEIKKQNWDYICVDASTNIVAHMKNMGFNAILSNVPPIPNIADSKFDVVFMEQLIEHMESPQTAIKLISQIHDLLNQHGLIFIIAPDFLANGYLFFDCDYTHTYICTQRRLAQLLEDNNFSILYKSYEVFSFKSFLLTKVIPLFNKLFDKMKIYYILGRLTGKHERFEKIKFSLMRHIIIVAKKT